MENLYKKRFPKRTFHQHVVDLLRLSPKQFEQFQTLAKQHLGTGLLHKDIPRPQQKILPSTWKTISEVDSPNTLAALIHAERGAHDDYTSQFHEGGGLWEGTSSLFHGLWNTIGLGPEFQSWFGSFDYDAPENRPTSLDNLYGSVLSETYSKPSERKDYIGSWHRDTSLDTDKFSVYVDDETHEIHVGIRGTKANMSDILDDIHVLYNNTSGSVDELVEYMERVVAKYPDWTLDASAHSLGGTDLIEAGVQNPDLGFDRYNVFNPGQNPFWGLNNAQSAVDSDKYHFYLNSGDMLSNGFASMVSDDTNVTWSKPKHSPLYNHGISQWTGDMY